MILCHVNNRREGVTVNCGVCQAEYAVVQVYVEII
jgi:hypothetical protein